MSLVRPSVPAAVGILLAALLVTTDGSPNGNAALAQGTDRLPGGVEHVPMPNLPSVTAPPPMPADAPAAPSPVAPSIAVPAQPDAATAASGGGSPKAAKEKPKRSKKAAPAAKKGDRFESMSKSVGPASGPGSGSSGDDRRPGGVEHGPVTPGQ